MVENLGYIYYTAVAEVDQNTYGDGTYLANSYILCFHENYETYYFL